MWNKSWLFSLAAPLLLMSSQTLAAQFDVVSVHPIEEIPVPPRVSEGSGRLSYGGISMYRLLLRAFGAEPYQLDAPEWSKDANFEINATMPREATRSEVSLMIRSMLQDRFKLTFHTVDAEVESFELVQRRGGALLTRCKAGDCAPDVDMGTSSGVSIIRVGGSAELAKRLSALLGKPVTDATGLVDRYEIILVAQVPAFTAQGDDLGVDQITLPGGRVVEVPRSAAPSISSALARMGLELITKKIKIPRTIIDSLKSAPTEN
jgi:uncharacterized protein (TIGR03435 family)